MEIKWIEDFIALARYQSFSRAAEFRNATEVAQEALASGRSVAEIVIGKGLLSQAQLDEILQPAMLTQPRKAASGG